MTATQMTDTRSRAEQVVDEEEARRARNEMWEQIGKWTLPAIVLLLALFAWDRVVVWNEIPHYILPGPGLVFVEWGDRFAECLPPEAVTVRIEPREGTRRRVTIEGLDLPG